MLPGDKVMPRQDDDHSSTKTILIVLGILGGLFLTTLLVCGGLIYWIVRTMPTLNPEKASPGLDLQTEDYAEARGRFKTKLLHAGPAPQPWQPVKLVPGVAQVEFPSGALKLKAWVNAPKGGAAEKKPAVLFLHGGFAFDESDWQMAQPFRDAGYITMTPILRGENGQPGTYTLFYDEVDDVLAAAEYLAKEPYVDADRIYVAGHSAGGTLTLLAAMTSKRFRAAASFSGSPDQVQFLQGQQHLAPFDRSDLRELQMRSPVAYATSFKCPVRLYYGSEEFLFDAPSKRTAMLAKRQGLGVEAVQVLGNHFTAVPAAMQDAIDFFERP